MVTVYARGEVTRAATPGDHVSICGVYLPIHRTGFAAIAQVRHNNFSFDNILFVVIVSIGVFKLYG